MAESLGARLRQQRERQQIALASIAEQTKISLSLLEGLERDDLSRWPAGIFRRAFVRAYAHEIGLEPDSVVREFLELHPDPVEIDAAAASAQTPTSDEPVSQGPATRLRWLIDRAIGSFPRRRLQLSFDGQESALENVAAGDRDSATAAAAPDPELAVAERLSTLTAIERATAGSRDSVKAGSPRPDLAPAAHLSTGTVTERTTAAPRDSVKAASPRSELATAAHLTTGAATERATAAPRDSVKAASPRSDVAAAAHLTTGAVTERATTATRDSVKGSSLPRTDLPAAAHLSTGTATERTTAVSRDSVQAAPTPRAYAPAARLSPDPAIESVTASGFDSANPPFPREPDLAAAAYLCTELGRVMETRDVPPLLEGAAKILNAIGLIVWIWDPHGTALRPALAHGYPDDVLAQLPGVRRDADNATATAFRSAETRIVNGSDLASGAVVVPLMTPGGCGGVLAVELKHGRENNESVRALATIFAAQLATLVGFVPLAEAVNA
jgi:transcriptional regulator with XRE-family HTH domain